MAVVPPCRRAGIQEADLEASALAQICWVKRSWRYCGMWTIDGRQRRSENVRFMTKGDDRRF